MKIAIVGAGISGLTAAYLLSREHDVHVLESEERIGGHTATIDVELEGRHHAIDTGFIVYNDRTYPNFIRLLTELGVDSQPTSMSFSVSTEVDGLEYAGTNLNTLFAQRRNLLSPRFWRLLRDILRFNRESRRDLELGNIRPGQTLGEYLVEGGYSAQFRERYLMPMGAAIWSSGMAAMERFPLEFFVRFFRNHGLLDLSDRPQWRSIRGGSREYLAPLTRPFRDRIRAGDPVASVIRSDSHATVTTRAGEQERFDMVVFACHSDQALGLLQDPTRAEREVLGAIGYQPNDVVLHTDERMLPSSRRAWSSWNYRVRADAPERPVLTYNMNILQNLESRSTFCVTLNDTDAIDPARILGRFSYSHPVFSRDGVAAQQRWSEVNGVRRTWFCGAYWGNGFHEDGVLSALRVTRALGVDW